MDGLMADDTLKEGREAFELSAEVESDNRRYYEEDVRFARLEEQWPEQIRRQRDLDGRPCLTINLLTAFTRQVVNDARQNKPAIKVHPADDNADPETAEVINGIIRNIEYTSNADVAYDTSLECAVSGGFGYFTIDTEYACDDAFDLDLKINTVVNPLTIYGDPYSTACDSADWNDAFQTEMLSRKAFERRFKGADPIDWDDYDRLESGWATGRGDEQEVRVAKWWRREKVARKIVKMSDGQVLSEEDVRQFLPVLQSQGIEVVGERDTESYKVSWTLMSGAEELDKGNWAGRYIPIVPVYGDVVHLDGKRHLRSMIRGAKDSQRMYNFQRTASTEMLALAPKAPFIGPKGAFDTDAEKWSNANNASYSFIEYDGQVPPQRQMFAPPASGAIQEALNASNDIKAILGMYGSSLGEADAKEASGRAILARQREGDVSTFHYVDNLARAIRHAGRILIDLIPSVYNDARVLRIMGEDGKPKNVTINKPYEADEIDEVTETKIAVEKMHDLTVGKYDLVVEAGPSYSTKREEAATQMLEMIRAQPALAPVIGDLLAKNLDWAEADEIGKRLEGMKAQQDPKAQQQAMAQAEMQKLQMQGQQKQAEMAQEGQLSQQKLVGEMQLKREQLAAEIALKREQLQAELDLKREQMVAEAQLSAMTAANEMSASPDIGSSVHVGGEPG
jgi:Phage P22-like portal protein